METVTHVRKPATLINVAYFNMLLIGALVTALAYSVNEGNAMTNLERVCQKSFIGYNYNPKLEKRCGKLWTQWTQEIKQSFNQ